VLYVCSNSPVSCGTVRNRVVSRALSELAFTQAVCTVSKITRIAFWTVCTQRQANQQKIQIKHKNRLGLLVCVCFFACYAVSCCVLFVFSVDHYEFDCRFSTLPLLVFIVTNVRHVENDEDTTHACTHGQTVRTMLKQYWLAVHLINAAVDPQVKPPDFHRE